MCRIIYLPILLLIPFCQCKNSDNIISKSDKPNVILIVVDDQGYADFEVFDNHDKLVTNPNIAKLARSGISYTQAYTTAPVCSPSRAGILTGKNQFRWDKRASWGPGLPDSVTTIAEYLGNHGYVTARIGKNDLGRNFHKNNVREYPTKHGYDEFLGFSAHAHDYWLHSTAIKERTSDPNGTSAVLGPLMHNDGEKSYEEGYLTDILTDEAIRYLEEDRDSPFFLTLAYSSVHHLIHQVPQKYLDMYDVPAIANYNPDSLLSYGKHEEGSYSAYYDKYSRLGAISTNDMRKYYLANLHCLDDNIGRFLDAIESQDLDKETIIIYISDNGGSPLTGANNAPLTGGKYSLWEGGIRVPMCFSWPGQIAANQIVEDYVSATDIFPTIAGIVGGSIDDETIDGVDLMKMQKDRLLVWKWQKTWAVRKGKWKLTNANENHWKSDPSDQYIAPIVDDLELKLFDIENDPGERIDLSEEHPKTVASLSQAYKEWCDSNIGKF